MPKIIDTNSNEPAAYTKQIGYFYKVGNLVHFDINLQINSLGSNINGTVKI